MRHLYCSLTLIFLFAIGSTACSGTPTAANEVKILPEYCSVPPGGQVALTLDGVVPPNALISWTTSDGSLVTTNPGLNAEFTAPVTPGKITITVSIISTTPAAPTPVTRQCMVEGGDGPTGSQTDQRPTTSQLPVAVTTISTIPPVIISEVMSNPCGDVASRHWNEYVELYNYGSQAVDVNDWWLYTPGNSGTPDQLVAWSTRRPNDHIQNGVLTNTTVIPPKRFAVILSPSYTLGGTDNHMPYHFAPNTIIMTAAASDSLGDDMYNIIGNGPGRAPVVLYIGTSTVVHTIVSTYGTPKLSQYVNEITVDPNEMPLDLHACSSAERIDPRGPDTLSNWHEVRGGSPGDAPYH